MQYAKLRPISHTTVLYCSQTDIETFYIALWYSNRAKFVIHIAIVMKDLLRSIFFNLFWYEPPVEVNVQGWDKTPYHNLINWKRNCILVKNYCLRLSKTSLIHSVSFQFRSSFCLSSKLALSSISYLLYRRKGFRREEL